MGIIIDSLNDSKLHSALAAGGVPVAILNVCSYLALCLNLYQLE